MSRNPTPYTPGFDDDDFVVIDKPRIPPAARGPPAPRARGPTPTPPIAQPTNMHQQFASMQLSQPELTEFRGAFKSTFDANLSRWNHERVNIQMEVKPFSEGGMRYCYRMWECDSKTGEKLFAYVAKIFKGNSRPEEYWDEAMTQMIAESYAQIWNRIHHLKVAFLPVSVMKVDGVEHLFCVEPYLPGDYVKHNDNNGHVETQHDLPQAFSHFSYETSDHTVLIVDIQGVGDFYTDPQIHSADNKGFGMGNLGPDGIQRFFSTHVCNDICRELGLPPVGVVETDEQMARRLQEEENRKQYPHLIQDSQIYTQRLREVVQGAPYTPDLRDRQRPPPR